MAGRLNVLLRGMAKSFGIQLKMSEFWKKNAEEFLLSQGITVTIDKDGNVKYLNLSPAV